MSPPPGGSDPGGLAHMAIDERDHRPHPQRLHDRRVQVLRPTAVQLRDQAAQRARMVQQQVEGCLTCQAAAGGRAYSLWAVSQFSAVSATSRHPWSMVSE